MACGVHLGILLICLVQAEHVRCLWATQAQRPNSNTYVGFTEQGSGFDESDPQDQFRQASGSPGSAQSSSLNTDPIGSGSSQRFPNSGYTQTLSQPANSGYDSVKLVQSSAQSKPNWRTTKLNWEHLQKMPKMRIFGLSASIAGGRSLSKYDQTPISKKRTYPVQQGTPSKSNHRSSSSESFQGPRESYSYKPYSHQTAAQKALVNSGAYAPPWRPSLQQAYVAPRRPSLLQQVNVAPRHPSLQQAYAAPRHQSLQLQQAYIAPQRPSLQQQAYVTSKLPLQLKSQRSRLFIQKPNGRWSGHTSDNKI